MTPPVGAAPSPSGPQTLADLAYRRVCEAIGSGELRPWQKITERGLAERLAVSPTPVREAIRRLEQHGLVARIGPRTVVVADIADRAVDDLAEVEVGLRGLVARLAARNAAPEELDRLDALLDEADDLVIVIRTRRREGLDVERQVTALLDRMHEFNETVEACAHNPVLVRLLEQSRVFSRPERRARLLESIAADGQFGRDRYDGHRELVRALRARDAVRAEDLVIRDAQGGLDALRAAGRRRGQAGSSPE